LWYNDCMNLIIKGNVKSLPNMPERKGRNFKNAARLWLIGDIGEAIAFWVLHKSRFWRIIKPLSLQHKEEDRIKSVCHFVSPNQVRQGLCFLPTDDELYYYSKIFSGEQRGYDFARWDFLAIKIRKESHNFVAYPCLIDVKTQRAEAKTNRDYESFKKRDFSREKELRFKIFCLKVVLRNDWDFEAELEEL
jgi:hypothetical protein